MGVDRKLLAAHGVGISICLPHMKNFNPPTSMTPIEVARGRGKEARRKGHPESENPYQPEEAGLSAEWVKGYGDTSK